MKLNYKYFLWVDQNSHYRFSPQNLLQNRTFGPSYRQKKEAKALSQFIYWSQLSVSYQNRMGQLQNSKLQYQVHLPKRFVQVCHCLVEWENDTVLGHLNLCMMFSKMTGHLLFLTPYVRNLSKRSSIIHWSGRIEIFKGQLSQSFTEIVRYNPPFNENGTSHGQQYIAFTFVFPIAFQRHFHLRL